MCSHAKSKVWFRSSNVQTQTFNSPRGSHCSEEESAYDTGVYHCPSSKWHDPPAARCHRSDEAVEQSGRYDDETRSNPNRTQLAKCQKCDSGSRPPSRATDSEKRIYLHLNLRNRDSPQLIICPKRNRHQRHTACSHEEASNSRDTVIDVDSLSLPLPSRPWSRMSEPAIPSHQAPRSGGPRMSRDSELQSLRQACGSSSKAAAEQPVLSPSPANQRQRAQLLQNAVFPRAMETAIPPPKVELVAAPRPFGPPQRRPPSIARDGASDETLLPLPKRPHGQQSVASQSTPRVDGAVIDSWSSTVTPIPLSSTKITTDLPLRVKGGSSTAPAVEEVPVESNTAEGLVLSWESLTVTSK